MPKLKLTGIVQQMLLVRSSGLVILGVTIVKLITTSLFFLFIIECSPFTNKKTTKPRHFDRFPFKYIYFSKTLICAGN